MVTASGMGGPSSEDGDVLVVASLVEGNEGDLGLRFLRSDKGRSEDTREKWLHDVARLFCNCDD